MYIMGIDPTKVRTSTEGAEFKLGSLGANAGVSTLYTAPMSDTGTTAGGDGGPKVYRYVKFGTGGVAVGQAVIINPATDVATAITTTLAAPAAGQGFPVGVAVAAGAADGFGWVQVYGRTVVNSANSTAIGTRLATSATGGQLVTGVGATTAQLVNGIVLTTAGATTGSAANLNWPEVGIAGAAN